MVLPDSFSLAGYPAVCMSNTMAPGSQISLGCGHIYEPHTWLAKQTSHDIIALYVECQPWQTPTMMGGHGKTPNNPLCIWLSAEFVCQLRNSICRQCPMFLIYGAIKWMLLNFKSSSVGMEILFPHKAVIGMIMYHSRQSSVILYQIIWRKKPELSCYDYWYLNLTADMSLTLD